MELVYNGEIYITKNEKKELSLKEKVSEFAEQVILKQLAQDDCESLFLFLGALKSYGEVGLDLLMNKYGIEMATKCVNLEKIIK